MAKEDINDLYKEPNMLLGSLVLRRISESGRWSGVKRQGAILKVLLLTTTGENSRCFS